MNLITWTTSDGRNHSGEISSIDGNVVYLTDERVVVLAHGCNCRSAEYVDRFGVAHCWVDKARLRVRKTAEENRERRRRNQLAYYWRNRAPGRIGRPRKSVAVEVETCKGKRSV